MVGEARLSMLNSDRQTCTLGSRVPRASDTHPFLVQLFSLLDAHSYPTPLASRGTIGATRGCLTTFYQPRVFTVEDAERSEERFCGCLRDGIAAHSKTFRADLQHVGGRARRHALCSMCRTTYRKPRFIASSPRCSTPRLSPRALPTTPLAWEWDPSPVRYTSSHREAPPSALRMAALACRCVLLFSASASPSPTRRLVSSRRRRVWASTGCLQGAFGEIMGIEQEKQLLQERVSVRPSHEEHGRQEHGAW